MKDHHPSTIERLFSMDDVVGKWVTCPTCHQEGYAKVHKCPPRFECASLVDRPRTTIYAWDIEDAARTFAESRDAFFGEQRAEQIVFVWAPDAAGPETFRVRSRLLARYSVEAA